MRSADARGPAGFEPLGPGDLIRLLYRLARQHATGVLAVAHAGRSETLVLRRGLLMTGEQEPIRQIAVRLEHLVSQATWSSFDGGVAAYPPGPAGRGFALVTWVRQHLEAQLDSTRAQRMVSELAGIRLAVRPELAPEPASCDETDRRILAAMAQPRRLDQIWPLARTPRFRLLAFIHFLQRVDAIQQIGIAAPAPAPRTSEAHRLLGVPPVADRETVKRAYRRLARALHPDLHGELSDDRRRALEHRLADVTAAYRELVGG